MSEFLELSKDVLEKGYYLRFRMQGTSMYTFLRENDIVSVKRVNALSIKPGHIIFYSTSSTKGVIHRVIKRIKKNGKFFFIPKGDANPYFDGIVDGKDILGRVEFIERYGRVIRINKGISRLRAIIYTKASFLKMQFRVIPKQFKNRVMGNLLRKFQLFKIYKYLVKKFIDVDNISYRQAKANDGNLLAKLYKTYFCPLRRLEVEGLIELFNESLKKSDNFEYWLLAQNGKKIIGSIMVKKFSKKNSGYEYWMSGPFVKWCYRRIGIGEQLIRFALQKAKQMGAVEVKTCISKRNSTAISFFKKLCGKVTPSELFPSELLNLLGDHYYSSYSYYINKKIFDKNIPLTFVWRLDK